MTICDAPEETVATTPVPGAVMARVGFTFSADGSYAACLARGRDGGWFPERWALRGPRPHTVSLRGRGGPERPGGGLLALPDGRVLICRRDRDDGRRDGGRGRTPGRGAGVRRVGLFRLAMLCPSGEGTLELPLGELELDQVWLVPLPAPGPGTGPGRWRIGPSAALAVGCAPVAEGAVVTSVWLVNARDPRPRRIAELPGRHVGGVWLDRAGRMLALDRVARGRVKTVVLDLDTGRSSPLLQIAQNSNDRLVLADPGSGLLVVRSDAPGSDRLGWGVLGSDRPVRFPECLRPVDGAPVTPFAMWPGAAPTPQECAVAVWAGGPAGVRCAVWRPAQRRLVALEPPDGWLAGAGHWSADGLRLPFSTPRCPTGVVTVGGPAAVRRRAGGPTGATTGTRGHGGPGAVERQAGGYPGAAEHAGAERAAGPAGPGGTGAAGPAGAEQVVADVGAGDGADPRPAPRGVPPLRRPVPLQQAPLTAGG